MHHFVHQEGNEQAATFWAGCGAIKRQRFLEMGGFDSTYRRPSIEDIELGLRLHKAGRRILLNKRIHVTHLKRWTFWGMLKADIRDRALPWTELILREGSMPNDLNLKLSHRLSAVMALGLLGSLLVGAWFSQILLVLPVLFILAIVLLDYWSVKRRVPTSLRFVAALGVVVGNGLMFIQFHLLALVPLALLLAIVALNWRFYVFLAQERQFLFAALALPLQVFFYLYSGAAFAFTCAVHLGKKWFGRSHRGEESGAPEQELGQGKRWGTGRTLTGATGWGLQTCLIIFVFTTVADWLLRPLHADGVGHGLLGYLNGLSQLLTKPGQVALDLVGISTHYHSPPGRWLLLLAVNMPVFFSLGMLLGCVWRPASPNQEHKERHWSRREFLTQSSRALSIAVGAGTIHSLVVAPRRWKVIHKDFFLPGLPASLDGLRAIQLTDIHLGPWLSVEYVRRVVAACNDLQPDLILLTGDYVHESAAYFAPVLEELARLRPHVATLGVLGNHDLWNERDLRHPKSLRRRAFHKAGILLIDNTRRVLTPSRTLASVSEEGLALCGVGDLWEDQQDYEQALDGLPDEMPRLLLSHNPDVAEEKGLVGSGFRVDLMLSGHTHGGQVWVPGLGRPITPSRYGQKYVHGLVQGPSCPVFICSGVGMSVLPLRIGVPPEIAVLTFHHKENSGKMARREDSFRPTSYS